MLNPYRVIRVCKETASSLDKIKLLKDNDSPSLRRVLEMTCSPFITFGVVKHEMLEPLDQPEFEYNLPQMFKLLEFLASRSITGQKAQEAITAASAHLNKQQQRVLTAILKKDLDCGVDAKTVNKAIPGLIPTFEVQLCNKGIERIKFPAYVEIKRNGRRNVAIVNIDTVAHFSRKGKEHLNFHCFDKELVAMAAGLPTVFDGEVAGDTGDHAKDYKTVSEQAKRKTNVDTSKLKYTVWDMLSLNEWKKHRCMSKQRDRSNRLKQTTHQYWDESQLPVEQRTVVWSEVFVVKTLEELEKLYSKVLRQGYEGLVVKDPDSVYEFKRSDAWIKMKAGDTDNFKIVGFVEGKKSWAGMLGSVIIKHGKRSAHCGLKGFSHAEARKWWKRRQTLVGKVARVEYMNKTDDSFYLPKCIAIMDADSAKE